MGILSAGMWGMAEGAARMPEQEGSSGGQSPCWVLVPSRTQAVFKQELLPQCPAQQSPPTSLWGNFSTRADRICTHAHMGHITTAHLWCQDWVEV